MNIPFFKYVSKQEEYTSLDDLLAGHDLKQVQKLEDDFLKLVGAKYALATSHGTSALHLAMLALELKRGDKVLCSVNAHPNVPEVVRHFDAEPVFIDIEPQDYNINLDLLEEYLKENTSKKLKAVIVTHIAGNTVELDRLYAMSETYNIKVVEDACDAFGATYEGNKIGGTGADITCFDFSSHLKQNIYSGGMLVTDDEEIMKKARLLNNHAIVRNENSLEYVYDVVSIGNSYCMSELNASFIRVRIQAKEENIKRQKLIAKMYNEGLKDVEHITLPEIRNDEQPFFLYIIKVDKNRDSFANELKKEGVETGLHYIPLHLLTYYKTKYSLKVNDFPVALRSYQQVLSLPIYAGMKDKDVEYVIEKIKKIAKTRV